MDDEAALADPALLPKIDHVCRRGLGTDRRRLPAPSIQFLDIAENLTDPSHTTFVHKQTIGNPAAASEPVKMEKTDEHIVAYIWLRGSKPSPMDVPIDDFGDQLVDLERPYFGMPLRPLALRSAAPSRR